METKFEHILLEYKEDTGSFHYNTIIDNRPHDKPNTYGWESIAYTLETKAMPFCDIIDAENHRRKRDGKIPLCLGDVKLKWREFSYIYNYILSLPIGEGYKELAKKHFKTYTSLARLGNEHFSEEPEFNDSEYNPMSFTESNF